MSFLRRMIHGPWFSLVTDVTARSVMARAQVDEVRSVLVLMSERAVQSGATARVLSEWRPEGDGHWVDTGQASGDRDTYAVAPLELLLVDGLQSEKECRDRLDARLRPRLAAGARHT